MVFAYRGIGVDPIRQTGRIVNGAAFQGVMVIRTFGSCEEQLITLLSAFPSTARPVRLNSAASGSVGSVESTVEHID